MQNDMFECDGPRMVTHSLVNRVTVIEWLRRTFPWTSVSFNTASTLPAFSKLSLKTYRRSPAITQINQENVH